MEVSMIAAEGPEGMATADCTPRVSEIIDQRPLSRFQLLTILLCGLVLVLDGFDTQSIGFLAPSMAMSLHISIHTFGPVFAAALIGLMLSSMIAGPIADRVGRKWPIVLATLTFAAFAIATAHAVTFNQLVVFRFLTGLGLGGAIPNVVALTTEYAPRRLQQVLVTTLFCSMPFGALLGGLVSSVMLPHWGWQSVFYVGGILPLLVALILIKVLPESIRFLSLSGSNRDAMNKIVSQIAPEIAAKEIDFSMASEDQRLKGIPVIHLFTEGRAVGTLLLWIPFFMNLLVLYFIISWLPALLHQTRMPASAGILGVSVFSLGGITGSLLQGRLMKAYGSFAVLLIEFASCLLLIGSLAFIASFPLMMIVTFLLGCFVQGAQAGLNALSATFYPTSIRSTGVGWALGVGRLGSIVGPIFGGMMVSHEWPLRQIFFAGAIPALIAAFVIALSYLLRNKTNPYHSAVMTDAKCY
jgi:MFS transporter, AAHS family, 4-hydroxybenzoate transporter